MYLRDGSALSIVHAATLRQKLQITLQALGRVATRVQNLKSLVRIDPEKSPLPNLQLSNVDALTTNLTRLSM